MSDERKSGVRTDISLAEFKKGLAPETPEMKRKTFFGKIKKFFQFLGILDDGVIAGGSEGIDNAQSFRQTHRVEPKQRSHEDWVKEHMAHEAYMDLVDGKGDCDHEH